MCEQSIKKYFLKKIKKNQRNTDTGFMYFLEFNTLSNTLENIVFCAFALEEICSFLGCNNIRDPTKAE